MPRYTPNSVLWKNRDWRRAPCEVKVVYMYLWDACDIAGFWEIDYDELALYSHVPTNERAGMFDQGQHTVESALGWLTPKYLWQKDGSVWLRHFLDAQCSLPLNPNNPMHRGILKRIAQHPKLQPKILPEIDCNQSPIEGPRKGVGIVRSSKVVRKSKVIGKAENLSAAVLTQADAGDLIAAWNTKARKKAAPAESLALEMVLRQVMEASPDIALSDIRVAVDNYHAASKVPGTRAGNFRLTNFIKRLPEDGQCYLPAFFDIDNYKQGGTTTGMTTAERLAVQEGGAE